MAKKTSKSNQILAFVTDKDSQKVLKSLPTEHLEATIDVHVGEISDLIEHLKGHSSPTLLVVDLSHSKLPASDIKKVGEFCEPGMHVVALGDKNEVGIFRRLLSLGVQDYIVKPLSEELLLKTFEAVLLETDDQDAKAFPDQGKLISFVGARGGVGVSTLLANCGFVLSSRYAKKTALIDLNIQSGMIAHFLDVEASVGFRDVIEAPERLDDLFTERVMVKQTENLFILSSEEALDEPFTVADTIFDALLPIVLSQFQYSLFDLSRSFTDGVNAELLMLSNTVVIVADATLFSVRDVVRLIKLARKSENPEQKIILVVNNQGLYQEGSLDHDLFEKSVQKDIDCLIHFDDKTPLVALNEGKPVAQLEGVLAQGIHKLVPLLINQAPIEEDSSQKQSFLNRFFARNE